MNEYRTTYPYQVMLTDNRTLTLTAQDNKNRVLITEVPVSVDSLRSLFLKNKFSTAWPEEKKKVNLGMGCVSIWMMIGTCTLDSLIITTA